jgi:hypothetical protein
MIDEINKLMDMAIEKIKARGTSREASLVITKLEEAQHWLARDEYLRGGKQTGAAVKA